MNAKNQKPNLSPEKIQSLIWTISGLYLLLMGWFLLRLRQSQLGAQLRFSLSSSAKHMTPIYPRYRTSEGCSSSGTEPSLLAQKNCHMPISTKKKPPTGRGPRWLKPGSIPTLRGDALLPSV